MMTIADTLVVRDGRVAFAGRRADINAAPGEAVVDLGGRTALPGLADAQSHPHAPGVCSSHAGSAGRRGGGGRAARGRARGPTSARRVDHRAQLYRAS
jgi:imidazolonepropionase-like amidohydrolase